MFAEMNATTVIPTDLVTPLGAYLRLRPEDGASFLLESVEHGRLGRHSFVGYGTRIVAFEEAEALDEPVVGYLGYDHVAKLEPTVPLPETGPDLPESLFVVADTLVKFDHVLGMAEILRGDPVEVAERLDGPLTRLEAGRNGTGGRTRRSPGGSSTCGASSARSSTSARATRSRSSSPSARSGRPGRPESTSTARSGA